MTVTVKLFAAARDIVGNDEQKMTMSGSVTASMILESLCSDYPQLKRYQPFLRVAVNREYVSLDHALADNDEVAILPPVSGG